MSDNNSPKNITKIAIGGVIYNIKDAALADAIAALTARVAALENNQA